MKNHNQTNFLHPSNFNLESDLVNRVYANLQDRDKKTEKCCLVDLEFKKKHGLSFLQAALISLIKKTTHEHKGCCSEHNPFFQDQLDMSSQWIDQALYNLEQKKMLWVCDFTKIQRHIVLSSYHLKYVAHLQRCKKFDLMGKCRDFFSKGVSPEGLPTEKKVFDKERVARELSRSFKPEQVQLGIDWFLLKSPEMQAKVTNQVAAIANAIKKGYAKEEILRNKEEKEKVRYFAEMAENLKRSQIEKREKDTKENKKFAAELLDKFGHLKFFDGRIEKTRFVLNNRGVSIFDKFVAGQKIKYYALPSGKVFPGIGHLVVVKFEMDHNEFKNALREFFKEAGWNQKKLKETNEVTKYEISVRGSSPAPEKT